MSKRVRDAAFSSLVRQEVSFFDMRSVGKITSELQDDAARVQTFTGDPIRSFLVAIASVLTGVILSFFVSRCRNKFPVPKYDPTSQLFYFLDLNFSSCGLLHFLL